MRIESAKRTPGQVELGLIFGGIALLALVAIRLLPVLPPAPACAFRSLTGFPCPTCGSTRAMVFLSGGDIFSAFLMNPLITAAVLFAVLYFPYGIMTLLFDFPRIRVRLTAGDGYTARWGFAGLLLAQWIYLFLHLS